ncbi:MAG: chromosome segregation protein SMC, partial [Pseudomonadota bacterium]
FSSEVASAEAAENSAETAYNEAFSTVEALEAKLADARATEADAAGPVQTAEAELAAIDAEIRGLERLLTQGDSDDGPPVIDAMRVERGFERALAAALGDDLKASLDPTASRRWEGKATETGALPGGAKPLSDICDAPAELAARISQCGIVDAEDGPRLAKVLQPGQRLVSQDGHLWRWDGFVKTPDAPVPEAERLEQSAQLTDAVQKRPALVEQLTALQATLTDAETSREALESALRDARPQVPETSKRLDKARRKSADARQAYEQAGLRRQSLEDTLNRLRSELMATKEALAQSQSTEDASTGEALAQSLEQARDTLAAARATEVEARGRLTDVTRGREQAATRRETLERDIANWERRKDAAQARLSALTDRQDAIVAEIKAGQAGDKAQADEKVAALIARADTLDTDRKAASDKLAEAERLARETESAARSATAAAATARESLAGAKVSLDMADARFVEAIETARSQFQRLPEGLLPLAQSCLSEETIETVDLAACIRRAEDLKRDRDLLGGVNMDAEAEAEEMAERLGAQGHEKKDLEKAIATLRKGVDALNDEGRARLVQAFETVNEHFKTLFTTLFRGGQAELRLVDADDPLAAGLEIFAQPPGKRLGTLQLMSGGEQALTAAALIFAVFLSNPSPVCVLDEVDAPLDDANVDRFCRM